jgi:hypothetical protein
VRRCPLPAARCLADVDADVELADRLADDGGYRLAEREKGDREPGRDSYLGDHRDAAALLAQHVTQPHPHGVGNQAPSQQAAARGCPV